MTIEPTGVDEMNDENVARLIERAISWEIAARDLYVSLSKAFSSHPSVAVIWRQMAVDESTHAAILRRTRDALSDEHLARSLGAEETALIESVEALLARAGTAKLRTLDDAYELAHQLESSEVNTVCQLLVSLRGQDADARALLDAGFEQHLGRIWQASSTAPRAKASFFRAEVRHIGVSQATRMASTSVLGVCSCASRPA